MKSHILFAALILFSLNVRAEDANPTPAENSPQAESENTEQKIVRNKDESWYFNFGLGYALNPDYGSLANNAIDTLKAIGTDFQRTPLTVELGAYWPLGDRKTVLGVSIFGVSDMIKVSGYELDITQSALAFSAITYFGENIGDGIFLRGDLGLARYSIESKSPSGTTLTSARSDWGSATQIGAGYSLPVSPETRLAAGLFFSMFRIKEDRSTNLSLQVSCSL